MKQRNDAEFWRILDAAERRLMRRMGGYVYAMQYDYSRAKRCAALVDEASAAAARIVRSVNGEATNHART